MQRLLAWLRSLFGRRWDAASPSVTKRGGQWYMDYMGDAAGTTTPTLTASGGGGGALVGQDPSVGVL